MLVTAEATWVSMLVSASVNSSPGTHVRLPFLALAVPAGLAVAWCAFMGRLRWRWWWKALALAPGIVIGAALSAGVIGELSRSGSWWATATRPWTVAGHPAAAIAAVAWFSAALTWGRGVWLGLASPSFRQVAWSLGLGAVAFIGIFAGRADHHAPTFLASTGAAGWLFFVFFPLSATAVALVRERQLEETLLASPGRPPGLVWVSVLAVPMLGVGLVALLLAVVVGPGAPLVGRVVARVVMAIWSGLRAAALWLWRLLPGSHHRAHQGAPAGPGPPHPAPGGQRLPTLHASFHLPGVVWDVGAAVLAVAVLYYLLRNLPPRMKWRPRPASGAVLEERSSLFSWRHLLTQVRRALPRWPRRRRSALTGAAPPGVEGVGEQADLPAVRDAYRRVLLTARAVGRGRGPAETPRELEVRLSPDLGAGPARALRELTWRYDDVRYGAAEADETAGAAARRGSDTVAMALTALAAGTDQPGPGPEGTRKPGG